MSDFELIPKQLAARKSPDYTQQIPMIIWQTMKTNRVPPVMKEYADSWIDKNPEYEYRFHDNDDIIAFIQADFPEYLDAYNQIKFGASKADLWRYLIMYKYGGVYADMDCRCIQSLRKWVKPDATFVSQLGINKDLCQWLIITVPGNPIFLRAAEKTLKNIKSRSNKAAYFGFELRNERLATIANSPAIKVNHEVLGLSGPPVLQEAAEACLKDGSISNIISTTQIVCVSNDTVSCQMNGNVTHETGDEDYKKALSKLKTPYYDRFVARVLRKLFQK